MLLSAQAAQLTGDDAAARRYFSGMLEQPETAFLALRGLLLQAQRDARAAGGFVASFPVVGTLLGIVCGDEAGTVHDFDDAKRTDERAYAAFFRAMLAEGVALAPGAYEALFVGLGHTDQVLDAIGEAAHRAAVTAAADLAAEPNTLGP